MSNLKVVETTVPELNPIWNLSRDPVMQPCLERAERVAKTEAAVLITGETGAGKGVLAEATHRESRRAGGQFVAINCAAIPSDLLESELFGHKKGSFTSATHDARGCFIEADGGTLFLDEISEMSPALQAKLLHVLERKKIRPVGSNKEIEVDFRLIAATNCDPEEAVRTGKLRKDLLYRISAFPVDIPPLRLRPKDIADFSNRFLAGYTKDAGKKIAGFNEEARSSMLFYSWPGNVRQLANTVHGAVIMCGTECITLNDIKDHMRETPKVAGGVQTVSLNKILIALHESNPNPTLRDINTYIVLRTLESCGGNRAETARTLDLSLKTVYNYIGVKRPRSKPKPLIKTRENSKH